MRNALRRAVGGFVLGIVAGALPGMAAAPIPHPQWLALKAREPQRAASALATALAARPAPLPGEGLAIRNAFTTREGRTVVRFDQTQAGFRVYGAMGLGHVEADGRITVHGKGLLPGAVPQGVPSLSADQAKAIALSHLGLKGRPLPPKVEQVVFPTALADGLKAAYDPSTRSLSVDRTYSVLGGRPAAAHVWAYQVDVFTRNAEDGITDMRLIIDAATGAVLKKLTNLQTQAAPEVLLPGTPAKGSGMGQYVGNVTLDTTQAEDGTFGLRDGTRGSLPNPYFLAYENIDLTGITTFWEIHTPENWGWLSLYAGKTANLWGDGFPFMDFPHEGDGNGETAAVDAHFGLGLTWDMYRNVFGREGLDGEGTTPFAQVHIRNPGTGMKFDNAMWSNNLYGMFFGDGTYYPDTTFPPDSPMPGNPMGMMSLTELDIAGHELSHGLTFSTAGLIYSGESGGLNEASSDIMGTLVEAYANRPAGQDDTIPDYGTDWLMGSRTRPSGPLRYMRKPSRDHLSADNWYEGLDWMEVHYSSGPMNRCFYYLAQGASASVLDETHSDYLPGGMDGIGNDKAGRIWFKALTEFMTPTTTYVQAGECMLEAAAELYGAASPEAQAVRNALTAINVQAEGMPLLTRVTFPVVHSGGVLGGDPGEFLSRLKIVPQGTAVTVTAAVLNNADTAITLKVGAHRATIASPVDADPTEAGTVNGDGTWTAPLRQGFFFITALSKARPEQFAEGLVLVVNLDADADNEQDAVDLGAAAFSWYLGQTLRPTHSPYGGYTVDDLDVQLFQEAIQTAWNQK